MFNILRTQIHHLTPRNGGTIANLIGVQLHHIGTNQAACAIQIPFTRHHIHFGHEYGLLAAVFQGNGLVLQPNNVAG